MQALLLDEREILALIERRRESGGDRYDEVWEGMYVMSPLASIEHQRLATKLAGAFLDVAPPEAMVLAGANVSDRVQGWEHNYRCPDVVVVLPGSVAHHAGTHWVGGPDLVVEVVSPGDRSREKLGFYAAVGVRELVLIDRDTKTVEVFRLHAGALVATGSSSPESPVEVALEVLPLTISSLVVPLQVILTENASGRTWKV